FFRSQERFPWSFSKAILSGMRSLLVVFFDPHIKICLVFFQCLIQLFPEGYRVEFILDGSMEAFTNSVALRTFYLCFRVLNIFDSQVEFIFMILSFSAIFGAAIGKDSQQWDLLFLKEWNHFVVHHIGCSDSGLTVI